MKIAGYDVIPDIHVTDQYKINYHLLQRLLQKYPHKKESDFRSGVLYILPNINTIICSPETYNKLKTQGDFSGTSRINFIDHINDFINRLHRLASR